MHKAKKLTKQFINKAKKVLNKPETIFSTDKELLTLINKELGKERVMSYSRFSHLVSYLSRGLDSQGNEKELSELEKEFLLIVEEARASQKTNLIKRILNDKKGDWKRLAWIGERKFDKMNLKHKVENTVELNMKDVLDNLSK